MNSMSRQRGVTLVELLVGVAILTVVAGAGLSMVRSSATAGRTAAQAVASEGGVVAVVRAMDELRSAVAILDAQPAAVTAVVSSASSGRPLSYRDPATGRTVTLDRYTVRYVFTSGALYRDTGNQPSWAVTRPPAGGRPIVPTNTSAPAVPSVGFPGQEPRQPQPVPDPGAPRYITVYQGRSYETVFSGHWLSKNGTSGLATTRAWAQSEWIPGGCWGGREERECREGYWSTKYYAAGPLSIDAGTYNSIRNNPVRNGDGSIAGYRVGDIWASPAGMNNIGSRPYYACGGWFLWWCTGGWYVAGYYVLGGSNELTASEYSSTVGSPMTAARFTDNYATVIDPTWQSQYDAYEQYQRDYQNWQSAHATWQQRYEAWTGYYRSYDRWSEQLALSNQANAVLAGILQPIGKTASSPWQPSGGVTLSNQAQVVARLASLRFSYADQSGNATADPAKVATITVSYTTTPTGRSASASASFAGSATSKSSARTWQFPTPCQADPRTCPPRPPEGDPVERDWTQANDVTEREPRTWYGAREWADGSVTYVECQGGSCGEITESEYQSAIDQVNAGSTDVGVVQTVSDSIDGQSGAGWAVANQDSGETWVEEFSWGE